ncbi:MAG: hypothetical protein M3Z92_08140 [Bacteroidota bacterium]|nr:hypothetical protein [Bacteroidota bacterium]
MKQPPCLGTGFGACGAYFKFTVRSKATMHDLALGQCSVYSADSISIIPAENNGQYPVPVDISDNQLVSHGQLPVDTLFLQLSQSDTDTLLMTYRFKKSYCCRSGRGFGTVTSIRFNGQPATGENGAYVLKSKKFLFFLEVSLLPVRPRN